MKQFFLGLFVTALLIVAAVAGFRGANSLVSRIVVSPTPSPTSSPSTINYQPSTSPTPTPTPTVEPSIKPTTKGGLVKGVTTSAPIVKKTVTTTTTTSSLYLTLVKTSICPISYMTEVKDIKGPLTLKYKLIDNTSFGITIWKKDGNELLPNTTFGGTSGTVTTISGVDYMKVRVESKSCAGNNDNWLTLTAER